MYRMVSRLRFLGLKIIQIHKVNKTLTGVNQRVKKKG